MHMAVHRKLAVLRNLVRQFKRNQRWLGLLEPLYYCGLLLLLGWLSLVRFDEIDLLDLWLTTRLFHRGHGQLTDPLVEPDEGVAELV